MLKRLSQSFREMRTLVGIKDFLAGSGGKPYPSPMFYKHNAEELAKAQKVYSRKRKVSRWIRFLIATSNGC